MILVNQETFASFGSFGIIIDIVVEEDMSKVFSMIQPSGPLGVCHILGTLKNWKRLQDEGHDCVFGVADLHAITVPQDPDTMRSRILDVVAYYLASGIDPEKSIIFAQSAVPQHGDMAWVLSTITSLGELNRMTQFKDKSTHTKHERVGSGLYFYPVLMAADILLYQTELIPVGSDQKQHVELARDIAIRFNQKFGEVFTVPDPQIQTVGARIMSLGDPTKKMSKSDSGNMNYLALDDPAELVKQKIMRSVTDSLNAFAYDPENQKGLANLIEMYAVTTNQSIEDIVTRFSGCGYGEFKREVGDAVANMVTTTQERFMEFRKDEDALREVLFNGSKLARQRSQVTMDKALSLVGFV